MSIRMMTYDELASALGITPDSARRLVARKKWQRSPGNDGRARIHVPPDALPDSPPDVRDDKQPSKADELTIQIVKLEGEIQALKSVLDIERQRSTEIREDRDAWKNQAEILANSRRGILRRFFG
jgi:hypothetical protein